MKSIVIIGVLLMLSAAAQADELSLEIGAGHNFSLANSGADAWNNADSTGFYGAIRYERKLSLNYTLVVHYMHVSQWLEGPPFNDKSESSLDHLGVAIKFNLMRW